MSHESRSVPANVVRAVRSVELSGFNDMYDRETVMMLAATLGHGEAAEWLVEHRHLYFVALEIARGESPRREVSIRRSRRRELAFV